MITIIDRDNYRASAEMLDRIYCFRHRLFVETMKWEACRKPDEIQKAFDTLFRNSSAPSLKPNQPITQKDLQQNPASWKPDFNIKLTRDEVEALLHGKVPCIQYGGEEGRIWDRGIVSPSGAHLRALSHELEAFS